MTEWYTGTAEDADRLLAAWRDAPTDNIELCGMLLDVARLQVITYGTDSENLEARILQVLTEAGYDSTTVDAVLALLDLDNPPTPSHWVYAQLQQAKNLWNAGRADGGGDVGPEGFVFQPRPLDKTIRGIIRPTYGEVDVF